jgi:hypothetical protein
MCVVDSLTKRAHFIPTYTTINVEGTALLFLKEVWKHHGTPQAVVSDRGPQFVATFTRKLYKLLGIKLVMSMAYHPQTNGQTEYVNQELEGYLCIFTSRRQDDWDGLLPLGEFSHNNHVHSSTQQTPFMVDTGRHPRMGFEPQQPRSKLESINEFTDHMALGIEEATGALTKAKDEYTCITTSAGSLHRPSHKGTGSGYMEATSLPTDHHLNCHTDIWDHLLSTNVSVGVHTVSSSLPTSATSTQSSQWSSCPLHIPMRLRYEWSGSWEVDNYW